MEQLSGDSLSGLDLQVDQEVRQQLTQAAKWTKFISLAVFISCALLVLLLVTIGNSLMIIFAKYGGAVFSGFGGLSAGIIIGIGTFVLLVLGVIFYFMFNFSVKIKNAMLTENTRALNAGLNSLKTFFIIVSVLGALSLLSAIYSIFVTA